MYSIKKGEVPRTEVFDKDMCGKGKSRERKRSEFEATVIKLLPLNVVEQSAKGHKLSPIL